MDKRKEGEKAKPKQKRIPSKDHNFQKRKPHKPESGDNVFYVSTKTNLNALVEKCSRSIQNDANEIIIYCLGAAVQRGILLALKLQDLHVSYQIHTNTFTTELVDDLEPVTDDADAQIQRRLNSALKIRLFRTETPEPCSSHTTS